MNINDFEKRFEDWKGAGKTVEDELKNIIGNKVEIEQLGKSRYTIWLVEDGNYTELIKADIKTINGYNKFYIAYSEKINSHIKNIIDNAERIKKLIQIFHLYWVIFYGCEK